MTVELICRFIKRVVKAQTGSAAGLIHIKMEFLEEQKGELISTTVILPWKSLSEYGGWQDII